ncbi:MAG TPA: penicillin-binding protein 2 [Candidatus Sulfotelmatobacter sp.]|nr:penicillin-binding protein 2 [Candidatus Sulfotelmatobacter sp.]
MALPNKNLPSGSVKRIRIWYAGLFVVLVIFSLQLFDVQVIKYSHYKAAALKDQLKQYEIPATRGLIEAHEGSGIVPIVLNQELYTLFADPPLIKNPAQAATQVQKVIGGNVASYESLMKTPNTQYVVLANKITSSQSSKILALKDPGLATQGQDYRVYPDGSLASQVLGFVNTSGQGNYGIEQALNSQLAGKNGELKAITDANGIPLAASKGNVEKAPVNGENVVLTLNLSMQEQLEQILKKDYQSTQSQGLSAVIMDPNTGQVDAMANYPTYDPSNYQQVTNPSLFENAAVTNAIEPGSTMKIMTTAAALNQGVIQPNTTFYDPAHWVVDGFNITDIEQDGGPRVQSIGSILNLSLNTGATWMLMQMGGGQIDAKGRDAWYDYLTKHYMLGRPTGIEQGYEAVPSVTPPQDNGNGIDLTYANMSFGQAIQLTPLQMAAADSAVLNGGIYYKPTLVSSYIKADGQTVANNPKVVNANVVSPKVSQEMIPLMEYVVQQHELSGFSYLTFPSSYIVGGKTGTAQIAQPGGGYYANKFNGTYVGFVGGNQPQYVIVVYNIQPNVPGYAGSYGGQPVFSDIAHMLINNSFVTPKS